MLRGITIENGVAADRKHQRACNIGNLHRVCAEPPWNRIRSKSEEPMIAWTHK